MEVKLPTRVRDGHGGEGAGPEPQTVPAGTSLRPAPPGAEPGQPGCPESGREGNRPAKVLCTVSPAEGRRRERVTPGSKDVRGSGEALPLRTRHARRQQRCRGHRAEGGCFLPRACCLLPGVLPFHARGVRKTDTPVPLDSGGLTRRRCFSFTHPTLPLKTCHPA